MSRTRKRLRRPPSLQPVVLRPPRCCNISDAGGSFQAVPCVGSPSRQVLGRALPGLWRTKPKHREIQQLAQVTQCGRCGSRSPRGLRSRRPRRGRVVGLQSHPPWEAIIRDPFQTGICNPERRKRQQCREGFYEVGRSQRTARAKTRLGQSASLALPRPTGPRRESGDSLGRPLE